MIRKHEYVEGDDEASIAVARRVEVPDCSNVRRDVPREELEEDRNKDSPLDGNRRVIAKHYNSLRECGMQDRFRSRILYMRNFNNWIKSMLIVEYINRIRSSQVHGEAFRVLDMCCGKGGDLLKWKNHNITHLICTDIADVSVEQCKTRYEVMQNGPRHRHGKHFTAEFFAADATLVRLRERYADKSMKLNLVSCQFAFHYAFESLSQADCMVRNAAECLQAGGYFIATIPDAYEIMRRLYNSENRRSFGNDIYNIDFICDTKPPPLFGAKYKFHLTDVVDCPEFLVHFALFVKLCRKHGLELVRKTTFADYYQEKEDGRQLLQRMAGLETVYPDHLKTNDEEYAHISGHQEIHNRNVNINTLSKSEWEAITLYLVCAFRKVKNSWDAKGNAVYEFGDDDDKSK